MGDESKNILESFVEELKIFISPLTPPFDRKESIYRMLMSEGWNLEGLLVADLSSITGSVEVILTEITNLQNSMELDSFDNILNTLDRTVIIIENIKQLHTAIKSVALPTINDDVISDLATDLFNRLIFEYLNKNSPITLHLFFVLGLIDNETKSTIRAGTEAQAEVIRHAGSFPKLKLDRITRLLTDPVGLLKEIYLPSGIIDTQQKAEVFVKSAFFRLQMVLRTLGFQTRLGNIGLQEAFQSELTARSFFMGINRTFTTEEATINLYFQTLFRVITAGEEGLNGKQGPGVLVIPTGALSFDYSLDDTSLLELDLKGDIGKFFINQDDFSVANNSEFSLKLKYTKGNAKNSALTLGSQTGTRLEIGQMGIETYLELINGKFDFGFFAFLKEGLFVISAGDGDSFIQKLLPSKPIKASFDFGVGWSHLNGVQFKGSGGLEIEIPVQKSIGPIKFNSVHVVFSVSDELLTEFSASIDGKLGPVAISIKRIGAQANLTFPSEGANLGVVNIEPSFKWPTGAGLSIDAGPITGAGYLEIDRPNNRYAGILALSLGNIQVTAIGLITTKLPDGSDGFSMLLSISAEFAPMQLSFGFTLNGVGGLIGIQRTMDVDVLRRGVIDGSLDAILFPSDPLGNPQKLIRDMGAAFPVAEGRYVFGPMGALGWGTPGIIRVEMGFIFEVPGPIKIALLGYFGLALPSIDISEPSAQLVILQMDFLGVLDFEGKSVSFDATLFDSRVVLYTISGDMAFRLGWGDNPLFAISFGGINPRFVPPPGFPELRRLTIGLGAPGGNPRLTLEGYTCITSNTYQFGSKLELYAKAGKFNVLGYMGFDAFFIFKPFSFVVDIYAKVALRIGSKTLFSVSLDFELGGPAPWRASGYASFKVLFVEVQFRFSAEFGQKKQIDSPIIDPTSELLTALNLLGNWQTELPGENKLLVQYREFESTEPMILVHPTGTLTVDQKITPMAFGISKFGNGVPPETPVEYDITGFTLNGITVDRDKVRSVEGLFAPAQFIANLKDEDKLTRKSFEEFKSGVNLGDRIKDLEDSEISEWTNVFVRFDTSEIKRDQPALFGLVLRIPFLLGKTFRAALTASSAYWSPLRMQTSAKYKNKSSAPRFKIQSDRYVITSTDSLEIIYEAMGEGNETGLTQTMAYSRMEAYLKNNSLKKHELQVTPVHEVGE